jgi:hypothetical protein
MTATYLAAGIPDLLLLTAAGAAITTQARRWWTRQQRRARLTRATAQRQPVAALPAAPVTATQPVDHTGADEGYGDQLRTINAVMSITAEQPVVEDTDTDRATVRTRSHIDDLLVDICGGDENLLAECREKASATSTLDLGDLWALLDAEDELAAAERHARTETSALRRLIGGRAS